MLYILKTKKFAPNILSTQRPKFVVIDELQEYVPIEHNTNDRSASQFINVLRGLPSSSVLVLLTGSMNYSTCEEIVNFIEKYFGIKMVIFPKREDTPVAKNRAHIQIIPHSKMSTAKDKLEIAKRHIMNKDTGVAMVMFSVKSNANEFLSQNGIYPIAKQLTLQLNRRTPEQVCGVRQNYSPFNPHPYDIFKRERNSTNLKSAVNYLSKNPESPEEQLKHLYYMLNQRQNIMGNHYTQNNEMPPSLSDPFLAECILCGFGYIANGAGKGFRMANEDLMLVQNLFKQGKIHFLFATDMIGVGTTLTIRTLYLPSLNKPKENNLPYGKINDSSLVQLVNRVGRQSNVAATIYCATEDYGDVHRLLNNDPSLEVAPAMFGKGSSSIEKQISLVDTVKMILNLIRM